MRYFVFTCLVSLLPCIISMSDSLAEDFQGVVSTIAVDHADGISFTESYILTTDSGEQNLLAHALTAEFARLVGKHVTLSGTQSDPHIIDVAHIVEVDGSAQSVVAQSESGLRLLLGVFDIGSETALPLTSLEAREVLMDDPTRSVRKLLEANSYNAVTISAVSVAERTNLGISLPPLSGSCYPWYSSTLLPAINSAFARQGIDPTYYDRVLLVLPGRVGEICNFAGLAISSRETFYSGGINPLLVLHELGHERWPLTGHGFGHASSDANNDGIIDSIYGDNFDAMGVSGYWYNFLHSEKEAWWVQAGGTTRTVSAPGVYVFDLPSAEYHPRDVSAPQRIRIDVLGDSRPYYITFRKMVGTVDHAFYDAFVDDRLNIHRPAVAPSQNTLNLGEVIEGNSYSLTSPRILVEFLSEANGVARVRVSIGPVDSDGDGIDNLIDTDDDNDGVPDASDCSPTIASRWTNRAYLDNDNDGIPTSTTIYDAHVCVGNAPNTGYTLTAPPPIDNCYLVPNSDQRDADHNGIGDACDTPSPTPTVTPTPTTPPSATATPAASPSDPPLLPPDVTPAPGNNYPILSVLDAKNSSGTFVAHFRAVGYSSVPSLACFARIPGTAVFGSQNYAISKKPKLLRRRATCRIPLREVGLYEIRFRSCEGTTCSIQDVNVAKH